MGTLGSDFQQFRKLYHIPGTVVFKNKARRVASQVFGLGIRAAVFLWS